MANYTNNERSNQINSNTYGYTSRNYEAMTALALNYFNGMASLSIHLPIEGAGKKDYTTFDYKNGVFSYLTPKDCKLLVKRGRKSLDKKEFESFSIGLKRGLVEVSTFSDLKKKIKSLSGETPDPSDICLVIYTDIDDNKRTENFLVHVFPSDVVIKDYQPSSGEYTTETETVEFEYFLDALEDFYRAMTNGYVHAQKHDSRFERKKWERTVYELATSLGLDLSKPMASPKQKSVGWNDSKSNFSNRDYTNYETEVVDAASEEDIDKLIENMQ